jgi:hypothetical protein
MYLGVDCLPWIIHYSIVLTRTMGRARYKLSSSVIPTRWGLPLGEGDAEG